MPGLQRRRRRSRRRSRRCCKARPRPRSVWPSMARRATDVTGFGLLGHLREMLQASFADAVLDPDAIPALDFAVELLGQGFTSSLHADNSAALAVLGERDAAHPRAPLLIDPQTAGGLLAGVAAARADACVAALRALGYAAAVIGMVEPRAAGEPRVRFAADLGTVAAPEPVVVS